jgi:predicted DNA-binding transcriptional regulator AlpA
MTPLSLQDHVMTLRIADGTERADQDVLLTDIKGLETMLERDERSLWRDHAAGRLPRPIKLGKLTKWRVAEIREWVEAGCPDRKTWEGSRKPIKKVS